MNVLRSALLLGALALVSCASGSPIRNISYSRDMTPGDVAHFRAMAEARGQASKEPLQNHLVAFPAIFLPALIDSEKVFADRVDEKAYHYHFEDANAFLLVGFNGSKQANFDAQGDNLGYQSVNKVLLGLLSFSTGMEVGYDKREVPTSSFSLLWGMLGTEKTARGRSYSLFWFPIN